MKKIICICLCLIFALSCITLPVSAAASPEVDDVISDVDGTDSDGKKIRIIIKRTDKEDKDLKPDSKDEKVIGIYTLDIEGKPKYPITIKMKVDGVKKTSKVYIKAKNSDGNVKRFEATVLANGKIKFTIDKYYEIFSIITDKKTSTQIGTSDKTGDIATPIIATIMLTSLAIVFLNRKSKEY